MRQIFWISLLASILLLGSCGQKASPQGGPRDKEPPRVTGSSPGDSTLNFTDLKIRFTFSEPIRKPTYDKEVFISPFVKGPRIILSDNAKKLRIEFDEALRKDATYLITLNDVKDLHESNPLAETHILAFSTGDQLDSMEIKGTIISPEIGKSEKKMTVLLFDADSIRDGDFFNVRPAYITKSTEQGDFSFKYLRNARYRVLALSDEDQSNTYNSPTDRIAIALDSVLTFEDDSTNFTTVRLYAYQPDLERPRLMNSEWITDSTLRLRFNKGLRTDGLKAFSIDTLSQDSQELSLHTYLQISEPELLLHVPRGHDSLQRISLMGLRDSLGSPLDTAFLIRATSYDSAAEALLTAPKLLPEKNAWEIFTPKIYRNQPDWFFLTDTAREERRDTLTFKVKREAFKLSLSPDPLPDSQALYLFFVSREITGEKNKDSLKYSRTSLKWFRPNSFSKLSGSVRLDSPYSPPIVMHLLDKDKKIVRTAYDTTFSFSFLPAGTYTTRIILDADSNGVWTPGSLKNRTPPEKIYSPSGTAELRENWDYPDFVVEVGLKKPEAKKEEEPETRTEDRPGPGRE